MKDTLTLEDIKRAVRTLKENENVPYITCLLSTLEPMELLKVSADARSFCFGGGIMPYQDKQMTQGMLRFQMSDGTFVDYPITNEPFYLSPHTSKEEAKKAP